MKMYVRPALFVAMFAALSAPSLAQSTMTGAMPSVENNGLIPPFLVIWLLAAAGVVCAITFLLTDRSLRKLK